MLFRAISSCVGLAYEVPRLLLESRGQIAILTVSTDTKTLRFVDNAQQFLPNNLFENIYWIALLPMRSVLVSVVRTRP